MSPASLLHSLHQLMPQRSYNTVPLTASLLRGLRTTEVSQNFSVAQMPSQQNMHAWQTIM